MNPEEVDNLDLNPFKSKIGTSRPVTPIPVQIANRKTKATIPNERETLNLSNSIDKNGVTNIIPLPNSKCLSPGLVRDPNRCQLFYECTVENGEWKIYNWRCSRGLVFDQNQIACVKGFC